MNSNKHSIIKLILSLCLALILNNCKTVEGIEGKQWHINNGVLKLNQEIQDASAKAYWAYISKVLPKDLLNKYISSLKLFTDGKDGELGGLSPLNRWKTEWELDVDTKDFNLQSKNSTHIIDYEHTLIHEFGHLLTLNPEQITITNNRKQKDELGYLTQEGYAGKDSYLGQFVAQFWEQSLLTEWDRIQRVRDNNKRLDLLYRFYLDHKEQFLTDYAAESPEEDIAEAWAFFVLADKPQKRSKKGQKIMFFYKFPALVNYRTHIRQQLQLLPSNYNQ